MYIAPSTRLVRFTWVASRDQAANMVGFYSSPFPYSHRSQESRLSFMSIQAAIVVTAQITSLVRSGPLARDMSESTGRPINRYGLTEINCSYTGANVDIVFVHGLYGHPKGTWTSGRYGLGGVFWPSQLLPPMVEEEEARILVYGYNADVSSFTDGFSGDKIHNHAEHLIAELCANRRIKRAAERPIVFVAHSLGGLVLKRALIYSSEVRGNYTEHLRSIHVSTYGILFLGTPHLGTDPAKWGLPLERLWNATIRSILDEYSDDYFNLLSQMFDASKISCETLQNIDRQFIQLIHRYHVYFFHEGEPTEINGEHCYIVGGESAAPVIQDVERACIQ